MSFNLRQQFSCGIFTFENDECSGKLDSQHYSMHINGILTKCCLIFTNLLPLSSFLSFILTSTSSFIFIYLENILWLTYVDLCNKFIKYILFLFYFLLFTLFSFPTLILYLINIYPCNNWLIANNFFQN